MGTGLRKLASSLLSAGHSRQAPAACLDPRGHTQTLGKRSHRSAPVHLQGPRQGSLAWPGRGLGDHVHPQPAEGSTAPPHSPIANHLARMKFKDRTYTLAKAIGLHPAHGVAFQHVSPKRAGTLLCSLPELPYLAGRPPSTGLKARCLDPRALGASTVCAFAAWVPEPGE